MRLTPRERARLRRARTVNPEAYREGLKGRQYLSKWIPADIDTALAHFRRTLGLDPAFAPGYAGIAECYVQYGDTQSKPVKEALALAKTAA